MNSFNPNIMVAFKVISVLLILLVVLLYLFGM
jgi:hypothetical protein